MAFVGMFSLQDLVGHNWDSDMGGGVHPTKCMHGCALKRMKTLLKQFKQVKLFMQNLSKLGGGGGVWRNW